MFRHIIEVLVILLEAAGYVPWLIGISEEFDDRFGPVG
jgi:hypothetical protein